MTLAVVLTGLVMVIGLAGTVLPFMPGILLIWAAALVFGILEDFGTVGWICFAVITVLSVVAVSSGFVLPSRAAHTAGANKRSILIGLVVAVVGAFVLPLFGFIVGGVAGIYVGERWQGSEHESAWHSTLATLKGMGLAMVVEFGLGVLAVITWIVWAISL